MAAEALGVEKGKLATQSLIVNHRLLLFKFLGPTEKGSKVHMHMRWKALTLSPPTRLAEVMDNDFPGTLNVTTCLHMQSRKKYPRKAAAALEKVDKKNDNDELTREQTSESETSTTTTGVHASILKAVGPSPDAQAAYIAG